MSWSHVCGTLRARPWPKGTRSTGAEKVIRVLWYYAELADESSGEAYPSQMTVAEELGLHLRDVQNAQKALVDQGFLTKVREPKLGDRGTTYRLAITLQSGYHEEMQSGFSRGTDRGTDRPEVTDPEFEALLSDPSCEDGHRSAAGDAAHFGQSELHDVHGDVHGEVHGALHGSMYGLSHGCVPGTTEIQINRKTEGSADSGSSLKLPWWPTLKAVRQLVNSLPDQTFYELHRSPQELIALMQAEVLKSCTDSTSPEKLQEAAQRAFQRVATVGSRQ